MGITVVGDGSRALGETSDRFQALANRISEIKEVRRQREIDQTATKMLLEDPSEAGAKRAEEYLVSQMAPPQRGGILGFADRLIGPGAAPQLSPLQSQVMARRGETAFPTPGQQREAAAETREAEMHPKNIARTEADTKRLEVAGDRNMIVLNQIGDALTSFIRSNRIEDGVGPYDEEIIKMTQQFNSLLQKVQQNRAATPTQGQQGQTSPQAGSPQPTPPNLAAPTIVPPGQTSAPAQQGGAFDTSRQAPQAMLKPTPETSGHGMKKGEDSPEYWFGRIKEIGGSDQDVAEFQAILQNGDVARIREALRRLKETTEQ